MHGSGCDAAIAKASAAVTYVQSQSQEVGSGDKGLIQQERTFGGWRATSSRDFAYFRVTFDIFYFHRGSGQARVYPRR